MNTNMSDSTENKKHNGVSIIVPAYNEEGGLAKVLDELKLLNNNYEIIVVDDNSKDNTANIVKSYSNVKLISHSRNLGYGAALKTGIRNAQNECIVITDADGTYPNEKIPSLIRAFEEGNFDMVIGARTGKNINIPLVRKPAKWFINMLANFLSGKKIPDLNSGLRVIAKKAAMRFMRILPDGFSFTTTITLAMLTNGYKVEYIPIDYYKRAGKSKIIPIRDTLNFIQLIIRTVLYFNPLKIFVPLSILLVTLAFIVLFASWLLLGRVMDVSFGVILMTAIIVLAIGMLADLIDKRLGD